MNQSWRREYLRYKSYFLNVMGRYKERADVKVYLEILLSLATISVFAIFALRPTILTIAGLLKEIETKKETLAKMDEKISNLGRAQVLFDQEQQNVILLNSSIPPNPIPDVFARQIEGLSIRYSVPISKISLDKATILGLRATAPKTDAKNMEPFPEGTNELPFSITFTVNIEEYQSLTNLISDLEKLRRPAKIDKLVMNTSREGENVLLSLAIEGRLPYYQNSQKEVKEIVE
ncbi:hypothetical protein A2962_00740 [Candidatus Woesebacteria bacterium RIFCSPLOWO2_01_FULL_39_61]|nr:MAG: hypothetical protein A2962_00740 [Candidatus Woesebacteria bacterium RIFCSPLOWO2_01_FULL_39_61]